MFLLLLSYIFTCKEYYIYIKVVWWLMRYIYKWCMHVLVVPQSYHLLIIYRSICHKPPSHAASCLSYYFYYYYLPKVFMFFLCKSHPQPHSLIYPQSLSIDPFPRILSSLSLTRAHTRMSIMCFYACVHSRP